MTDASLELGAFSISLAVNDLPASREFYEKLGFSELGGDGEHYVILRNGTAVIGLFHGMFERNILTFNPGFTQKAETLLDFTDVRAIRNALVEAGIKLDTDLDPNGRGPASVVLTDPDGNPVLIDQHVPAPGTEAG